MRSLLLFLLSFVFSFSIMAQQTTTTTSKLKGKVGWLYSFGLGYRSANLDAVNAALFPGVNRAFDNGYLTGSASIHAVFFDRVLLGLESDGLISLKTIKSNINLYTMTGTNLNVGLGYNIINNETGRLSINYGIGADINMLTVQKQDLNPTNFNTALNSYSTNTLNSANFSQKVSLRYDFITRIKESEKRISKRAWGIEAGYYFTGNNSWSDLNFNDFDGPSINNDGVFVRALYSFNRTKKST